METVLAVFCPKCFAGIRFGSVGAQHLRLGDKKPEAGLGLRPPPVLAQMLGLVLFELPVPRILAKVGVLVPVALGNGEPCPVGIEINVVLTLKERSQSLGTYKMKINVGFHTQFASSFAHQIPEEYFPIRRHGLIRKLGTVTYGVQLLVGQHGVSSFEEYFGMIEQHFGVAHYGNILRIEQITGSQLRPPPVFG